MLPKFNNCIDAIESGVSRVHILDGRIPHCLLLEIFTNKGIGTAILNAEKKAGIMMVNSKIQAAEEESDPCILIVFRLHWIMEKVCICMIQKEKNIWILQQDLLCLDLDTDNKELNQALKDQIDKLYHTSNLILYTRAVERQHKELNRISGMDRVFFTNSGRRGK